MENFNVIEITKAGPYLVCVCYKVVPDVATRPFTIVGCVIVWLNESNGFPHDIGLGGIDRRNDLKFPDNL